MTGWALFFAIIGVLFMTAQLFRIIDAIERPRTAHPAVGRRIVPLWRSFAFRRTRPWMFWKS